MASHEQITEATRQLETARARDLSFPALPHLLQSTSSVLYSTPHKSIPLFRERRFINLPDALFEQYDLLQCRCFMGLFPEIQRAWITIDHRLYLWNYNKGNDFYLYEELDQVILSVGLVKPRPGLFVEEVEHLLVLTTPLEIVLLGLSIEGGASSGGEVMLYATQMSMPSDGVIMTSIVGTDAGRIFACGNDGHIYEIAYGRNYWMSSGCSVVNLTLSGFASFVPPFIPFIKAQGTDSMQQVAVDNSRRLVYGLLKSGTIEVFSLGKNGAQFNRLQTIGDIVPQVSSMCPALAFDTTSLNILSIHPMQNSASSQICLIAVTANGCRLYFSIPSRLPNRGEDAIYAESSLFGNIQLCHVRLPPVSQYSQSTTSVAAFHLASLTAQVCDCSEDVFLVSHNASGADDYLMCTALDAGSIENSVTKGEVTPFVEQHAVMGINGKAWAIVEESSSSRSQGIAADYSKSARVNYEMARWTNEPPRTFIVLSNNGVSMLTKLRPIDQLEELLTKVTTRKTDLDDFVNMYGPSEVCCMCVSLFIPMSNDSERLNGTALESAAARLFLEVGGRPRFQENTVPGGANSIGRAISTPTVKYSHKHSGITRAIERLLNPIWEAPVVSSDLKLLVREPLLLHIRRGLFAIRDFMTVNFHNIDDTPRGRTDVDIDTLNVDQRAWETERQSLRDLKAFITHAIEGIAFILLVCEHKPANDTITSPLASVTFNMLLSQMESRVACKDTVLSIIDKSKGRSFESLSRLLRERCPHFCTADHLVLFQAQEALRHATVAATKEEKTRACSESLRLYKSIPDKIDLDKINEIVEVYMSGGFYLDAIDLALSCATAVKPDYPDSEQRKQQCYQVAIDIIYHAQDLFGEDTNGFQVSVLSRVLASKDRGFHFALYDSYMQRGYLERIIQYENTFVEDYLLLGSDIRKTELLWKYYIGFNQFVKAANLQENLALSERAEMTLDMRVDCLTRAIRGRRSVPNDRDREASEKLRELQERLEVAQLQVLLLENLQKLGQVNGARELQQCLYPVNELFHRFALPNQMHDMQLLIYYVSGFTDAAVIKQTWLNWLRSLTSHDNCDFRLICRRVGELAQRLAYSEIVFPLEVICDYLGKQYLAEQPASGGADVSPWMADALIDCSIPSRLVFTAINSMIKQRSDPWHESAAACYLMRELCAALNAWITQAMSDNRQDFPAAEIDDELNRYLLAMNTMHSADVARTIQELKRRVHASF